MGFSMDHRFLRWIVNGSVFDGDLLYLTAPTCKVLPRADAESAKYHPCPLGGKADFQTNELVSKPKDGK
jgi:hypothetical protein